MDGGRNGDFNGGDEREIESVGERMLGFGRSRRLDYEFNSKIHYRLYHTKCTVCRSPRLTQNKVNAVALIATTEKRREREINRERNVSSLAFLNNCHRK